MAYNRGVSPVSSDYRLEYALAGVVQMIANTNRDPKKRKQPYVIGDFLPDWEDAGRRAFEDDEDDTLWQEPAKPWEDWQSVNGESAKKSRRSDAPQSAAALQNKAKFWTQLLGGTFEKTIGSSGSGGNDTADPLA